MQVQATDFTLELVQRIKNADPNAVAELYDNYSSMLYGILLRIVADEEEAQNLLQDCFVKIWGNIESYDEEKGRFATWLINIARNIAIDFIRSKYVSHKQKTQSIRHDPHHTQSKSTGHIDVDTIGLKKILEHLNPTHRQVIDWMYFEGYTQEEISDKFNLPPGTVKSRARAAIHELRNYFEPKN